MAPPPPRRLTTKELHLQDIIKHKNIKLEEANFDLESQTAFHTRALQYAHHAALTKALQTRAMHPGSRYLALRPTLPHRDLPEGPVIFEIPRLIIPKRRARG
ncbi:hypothetical protein ABPG75_006549 [Micractinium tetrahymenae]